MLPIFLILGRKGPMYVISNINRATADSQSQVGQTRGERGAALATALIVMSLLGAVSMTVLAVVTHEARIAGSDLQRTQTFYAGAASMEKMTSDFCALFARTSRPTTSQLNDIAASYPAELTGEGFAFSNQSLTVDPSGSNGTVTIPTGPFSGLVASVTPYLLDTTATQTATGAQVRLQRKINNYLIPIFQFGMFSNEDLEVHPGPPFAFNGRVHANGNLYVSGDMTFLSKVTTANELVVDVLRNGSTHAQSMSVKVGAIDVPLTAGSVVSGPNISGSSPGLRGYFPGSPNGTASTTWDSTSVASASTGIANKFGGQVLTRTTGGVPLLLPMQIEGSQTKEIIRRMMPNDSTVLSESRYHQKAQVRILIDDESPTSADAAGIPAGLGVNLSTFDPIPLPNAAASSNGGRALWRINDSGSYVDTTSNCAYQQNAGNSSAQALTVRGVKSTTQNNVTPTSSAIQIPRIPAGAGLKGRILIQIVDSNGNARDVTRQILSMGVTVGEPNAIINLQRPLWTAFTQGGRDASGTTNPTLNGDPIYTNSLVDIITNTHVGFAGEIKHDSTNGYPTVNSNGYLTKIVGDTASGARLIRSDMPPALNIADYGTSTWNTNKEWNAIVPINIYNVREGRINSALSSTTLYERGMTNVVEINMRNLARWLDGVYDTNLLSGTTAISTNIGSPDGYTVYVSDRRGDRVESLVDSGITVNSTNGMVDNEDIYGPNNILDPGEDVQGTGTLVKDTNELADPVVLPGSYGTDTTKRALTAAVWPNLIGGTGTDRDNHKYFRNSVRVFNGENLQVSGGSGKLSPTKGITISSENMVYLWGNFNTTGINLAPPDGTSSLNDSTTTYYYLGNQVPTSIVCDAIFPLSKTFYDSETSLYPDDLSKRQADGSPSVAQETSVRAAILAGNNLSALSGSPDAGNSASGESRLCGGMHNFPRFLEDWSARWNFVGSMIPLYHSVQAVGQYNANSTIYGPPTRNWAFDITFTNPNKLPPGTPMFQHIEPTGFKQLL
jgi:Tfp pilus assembly protein PilX